jgi:hypothetical protein
MATSRKMPGGGAPSRLAIVGRWSGAAYEHIFYEQRLDYESILSRSGRAVAARRQPVGTHRRSRKNYSFIRSGKGWDVGSGGSTLKFFRLRRADYLLKNTSVSCTFWEPDPPGGPVPAPSVVLAHMITHTTPSPPRVPNYTLAHIHTHAGTAKSIVSGRSVCRAYARTQPHPPP